MKHRRPHYGLVTDAMFELTWLRRPDTVCPSDVRTPTVSNATRPRMRAYSKSTCPSSSPIRRTASVQRFLTPARRIRPSLPLPSFVLGSDRREARVHAREDALHVETHCLQDCDRNDRDQCQDQCVLDERLTFLTLEAIPHSHEPAVQLCLNPQHIFPSLRFCSS